MRPNWTPVSIEDGASTESLASLWVRPNWTPVSIEDGASNESLRQPWVRPNCTPVSIEDGASNESRAQASATAQTGSLSPWERAGVRANELASTHTHLPSMAPPHQFLVEGRL